MTMWDAPSDRDYAEYLNPSEPDEEPQPDVEGDICLQYHGHCSVTHERCNCVHCVTWAEDNLDNGFVEEDVCPI